MGMARQSELSTDTATGIPVLVTRPQAQAEGFVRKLTQRLGPRVRPVISPLMAPEFLSQPVPEGDFSAVIFTSAQGVEGARRLQADLPRIAYCVGRSTAAFATAAGFEARSADGDAAALLDLILSTRPVGPLLYIRGVHTVGDIEKMLSDQDIMTRSLQVYLQSPKPLSRDAVGLLQHKGRVIVPLFSPRTARLFRNALPKDCRADLHIAAMSAAVAEATGDLPRGAIVIAETPDADAMLDAVESLLSSTPAP
jgi:uroporphyrinogen-III synthase